MKVWAALVSFLLLGLVATGAGAEDSELRHPSHAWLFELRVAPQLSWISGTIEATRKGESEDVDLLSHGRFGPRPNS